MRKLTNEEILDLMSDGYSTEEIEKGYGLYSCSGSSLIIENALIVEKVDAVNKFEDDWEACRYAEKDGVKFINDMEHLEKGCYVDTPENRVLCEQGLKEFPEYWIENLMKNNPNSEYWDEYRKYCEK